jgi:hypothetical protein
MHEGSGIRHLTYAVARESSATRSQTEKLPAGGYWPNRPMATGFSIRHQEEKDARSASPTSATTKSAQPGAGSANSRLPVLFPLQFGSCEGRRSKRRRRDTYCRAKTSTSPCVFTVIVFPDIAASTELWSDEVMVRAPLC